jgi:hypothetical protein
MPLIATRGSNMNRAFSAADLLIWTILGRLPQARN